MPSGDQDGVAGRTTKEQEVCEELTRRGRYPVHERWSSSSPPSVHQGLGARPPAGERVFFGRIEECCSFLDLFFCSQHQTKNVKGSQFHAALIKRGQSGSGLRCFAGGSN